MRRGQAKFLSVLLTFTIGARILAARSSADDAFHKLEQLSGQWQGTDEKGRTAATVFQVVAARTAVMETLSPPGMEEMVSLYSIDKDGIAMIHFCPTNNQPHMRAVPSVGDIRQLVFTFLSAGNLPTPQTGHQHKLVIRFDDSDHITEFWTWRENGNDTPMTLHFVRKKL